MSESIKKYANKEGYIVPMTVEDKAGHLHRVIRGEMAPDHIRGKRVLHVGCNAGTTTYHLTELLPSRLAGVDVNLEAVAEAAKLLPHADIRGSSAHDLPFTDDSFDTIILFDVFEHLYHEDKSVAVGEFIRVLKHQGHILISVPRAIRGSKAEKEKTNAFDPHHVSFYFKEDDVHADFPGWDCKKLYFETRRNPNNDAPHCSWVGIYQSPKSGSEGNDLRSGKWSASI